jgi:hypothetical protein
MARKTGAKVSGSARLAQRAESRTQVSQTQTSQKKRSQTQASQAQIKSEVENYENYKSKLDGAFGISSRLEQLAAESKTEDKKPKRFGQFSSPCSTKQSRKKKGMSSKPAVLKVPVKKKPKEDDQEEETVVVIRKKSRRPRCCQEYTGPTYDFDNPVGLHILNIL